MPQEPVQQANGPERSYLSPEEFSRLSGLSLATVHRRLQAGQLPFRQPGGPGTRLLIPANALDQGSGGEANPTNIPAASAGKNQKSPQRLSGPPPQWQRKGKQNKEN
jgi:hypothetical protein